MGEGSSSGSGKRLIVLVLVLGAVGFAGWRLYRMMNPGGAGVTAPAGDAGTPAADDPTTPAGDPEKRAQPGRGVALPGK